jgi:hypothetical protein
MTADALTINYVAIAFCAVSSMVIGSLWYSPFLFGTAWIELNGLGNKTKEAMMKDAKKAYGISIACALVLAYVLAMFTALLGVTTVDEGVVMGFWLWLGLTAMTMATSYAYLKKPLKLLCIDSGYWCAVILTMSGILAVWR